ncbi:MAG TPA: hypothetical protein VFA59_11230 [Vicinamibacterales bacterium]|nr:hypothetical protein [Vicinamibacterales bacterium]
MPKRSSTGDEDEVTNAFDVMAELLKKADTPREKNPAAVALGKLGGLKGGKARAKALSKSKRSAIARKAAKVRWKRHFSR